MEQKTINFTECDDLQITSHLNMENLPQILQDLLSVAHTTEQKDMLLMSSLTTLSTVMNSVYFRYGTTGKRYYPEHVMGVAQRTAERYLNLFVSNGQLLNPHHGIYKKSI